VNKHNNDRDWPAGSSERVETRKLKGMRELYADKVPSDVEHGL
jgi:hypothetical protein